MSTHSDPPTESEANATSDAPAASQAEKGPERPTKTSVESGSAGTGEAEKSPENRTTISPGLWRTLRVAGLWVSIAGAVIVALILLFALGRGAMTEDFIPQSGSGEDRWWGAELLVALSLLSAYFVLFLAVAKAAIAATMGQRPVEGKRVSLPTGQLSSSALLLLGCFAISFLGTVNSGPAWNAATSRRRDEIEDAARRLLSGLEVQWSDANANPLLVGERPPGGALTLPMPSAQLTAHNGRVRLWVEAAKQTVGDAEKVDLTMPAKSTRSSRGIRRTNRRRPRLLRRRVRPPPQRPTHRRGWARQKC